MSTPILVLGSGYTGRFLASYLSSLARPFYATSRVPDQHLAHLPVSQRLRFDLADPVTWAQLPTQAALLWCFPAAPLEAVQSFARLARLQTRPIVVLGSTSAYEGGASQEYPPPWIDEQAAIDLVKPRVHGEEFLRKECGAIVLRVAGIYGPGRNPLDWIAHGRVGASRKYVNLIHVQDLAAICLAALDRGSQGESYNVSDGTPRTWSDICEVAHTRWGITARAAEYDSAGKRISVRKLGSLGVSLQHADLYAELDALRPYP